MLKNNGCISVAIAKDILHLWRTRYEMTEGNKSLKLSHWCRAWNLQNVFFSTEARSTIQIAARKKQVFVRKFRSFHIFPSTIDAQRVRAKTCSVSTTWRRLTQLDFSDSKFTVQIISKLKIDKRSSPLVIWLVCGKICIIHCYNLTYTKTFYTTRLQYITSWHIIAQNNHHWPKRSSRCNNTRRKMNL